MMPGSFRRSVWPFPEVLPNGRGGAWSIRDSEAPRVDLLAHFMWVPLDGDPADACRRSHEMAHARWSRRRPPRGKALRGTRPDTFMAVEDARMHIRLRERGVDLSAGLLKRGDARWFRAMLEDDPFPLRLVTLALVASHETGSLARLDGHCRSAASEATAHGAAERAQAIARALAIAGEACAMFAGPAPLTRDTLRIARWVDEALGDAGAPLPATVCCLAHGEMDVGKGRTTPWGTLTVEEPALTVRRGGVRRREPRATDAGTVPRGWHRWPVDRAVFTERARPRGTGTLLVDMSGSMHLEPSDLIRAVDAVAHMTVATYSAHRDRGTLRVVARPGGRVDRGLLGPPAGSMNVVDGPALEWLARQPGPRLWVCDGAVTGVGDQGGEGNVRECEAICRRAAIRRFPRLTDALGRLR